MKKFNFKDDVNYTFSFHSEHIRFLSTSFARRSPTDPVFVGDSYNTVKNYVHWRDGGVSGGLYQTCFDRDHSTPESIPLIDFAFGVGASSSVAGLQSFLSGNSEYFFQKNKIYNIYAQQLLGRAGRIFQINGEDQHELIFVNVKRHQFKDSISPATLRLVSIYSGSIEDVHEARVCTDSLSDSNLTQTPGGLRGEITAIDNIAGLTGDATPGQTLTGSKGKVVGHIYYQAGILVLVPKIFSLDLNDIGNSWFLSGNVTASYNDIATNVSGSNVSLDDTITAVRHRFLQIDFRSSAKVRSTFYKTFALKEEYNYSTNPSFVDSEGLIKTTSGSDEFSSRTYITKIGLLGTNSELIAIGQLSRPVRKDFDTELEIIVRLDY